MSLGLSASGRGTALHRREALAVDRTVEHAGQPSRRSLRTAARKVAVFHLPCGTLSKRRSPRGAQP